ncbi:hypothetical protein WA026_001398 [Henosepilachna vigintioctopunctata]|uniref:Uncharacterized protein n=1 Tax=Henosepilachna vigintioctopunctata TaxID=420089 RepID=A0AAW1UR22_9CUCU
MFSAPPRPGPYMKKKKHRRNEGTPAGTWAVHCADRNYGRLSLKMEEDGIDGARRTAAKNETTDTTDVPRDRRRTGTYRKHKAFDPARPQSNGSSEFLSFYLCLRLQISGYFAE